MSDEGFIPGPASDTLDTGEKPPEREAKRGPGRPRKDGTPAQPRTTSARKSSKAKQSLEGELLAYLNLANLLFAFAPDEIRGDALEPIEMAALAKTVNEAAMSNSQFYNALDAILRGGQGGILNLVVVVGCILGRRLIRHGVIPTLRDDRAAEFDGRLLILTEMIVNPSAASKFAPPVETTFDWGNGGAPVG